jgi:hypothetical protein
MSHRDAKVNDSSGGPNPTDFPLAAERAKSARCSRRLTTRRTDENTLFLPFPSGIRQNEISERK